LSGIHRFALFSTYNALFAASPNIVSIVSERALETVVRFLFRPMASLRLDGLASIDR
jgi:hypothetical protein